MLLITSNRTFLYYAWKSHPHSCLIVNWFVYCAGKSHPHSRLIYYAGEIFPHSRHIYYVGEIFPHSGEHTWARGSGFFLGVILLVSFRLLYGNDFFISFSKWKKRNLLTQFWFELGSKGSRDKCSTTALKLQVCIEWMLMWTRPTYVKWLGKLPTRSRVKGCF